MPSNENSNPRKYSECPYCERHTYQRRHFHDRKEFKSEGYWSVDDFEFLQCLGCDKYNYKHTSLSAHSPIEERTKKPKPDIKIYPVPRTRKLKDSIEFLWLSSSPIEETVYALFDETNKALEAGNYRLVAMGVRAIIETLMIGTVGDKGTLTANLQALEDEGHISRRQHKILEDIIEIGSATIHRQFSPSKEEAETAMDISESLVESVLVFPNRAEKLSERVPARPKKAFDSSEGE